MLNFPFQFGIEFIKNFFSNDVETTINYGAYGYLTFNLYDKKVFIKLEIGGVNINDKINYYSAYLSLGFSFNIPVSKHNSFIIDANLTAYKGLFLPLPSISIKYMYILNKYFGFTTGIKAAGAWKPYFIIGTHLLTY